MLALLLAAFAQNTAPPDAEPTPASPSATLVIPAPSVTSCRSLWPKVKREKSVDIPQWAKDEGHNGRASVSVTVDPDGSVAAIDLVKTSGSDAINKAVMERARQLEYSPAIDAECQPTRAAVRVTMQYGRFDKDSPGGGLDGYTCGYMLREYDWFVAAKGDGNALFIPQFTYVISGSLVRLEQGEDMTSSMMDAEAEKRVKAWDAVVERCRKAPDTPLLDEIDFPAMYRKQVDNR